MPNYGAMEAFSGNPAELDNYSERLEQYFIANDLEEIQLETDNSNSAQCTARQNKRRAILLSVLGASTYEVLRNLCLPQKPADKSYTDLIQLLKTHYSPKPSETVQRYKFNTRQRHQNETISSYVAELRRLAEHCNYGNILDDMLRDRLVCGVNDEKTQRLLLMEDQLTLKKAFKIASAQEAAERDVIAIKGNNEADVNATSRHVLDTQCTQGDHQPAEDINKVSQSKQSSQQKMRKKSAKCYRCGNPDHLANRCQHVHSTCSYCRKIGHIARVCRKKERDDMTNDVVNDVTKHTKQHK